MKRENNIGHLLVKCDGSPVNFDASFGLRYFGSLTCRRLCSDKTSDVSCRCGGLYLIPIPSNYKSAFQNVKILSCVLCNFKLYI
jgi:hypothetical protein